MNLGQKKVWWFEIDQNRIKSPVDSNFHFLCKVAPNDNNFYYLKVPAQYLQEKLQKLVTRDNGKVSIFLSAESHNMLQMKGIITI